jgi:hypothetical protein
MEVKSIDVNSAKAEVKKCPKVVRDYVAALERRLDHKQKLVDDAISELRKARRQVKESDSLPCVSVDDIKPCECPVGNPQTVLICTECEGKYK